MATQDISIWDETNVKAVSVITDGTTERLAVDAKTTATEDIWQTKVREGKAFFLTTDLITVSGTVAVPFLLLRNPAGSGKTIRIWRISYNLIASITSDSGTYKVYRDPTVTTNGTTKTPIRMIKSQALTTSVLLAGTAPTVSAVGTLLYVSATTSGGSFNIDNVDLTGIIEAGENRYFTLQPAVTGKAHGINVWYYEE